MSSLRASSLSVLALAAFSLAGCGLVLDLDPPDSLIEPSDGGMDASVVRDGGGGEDGGGEDGGGEDGGDLDGGAHDSGPDRDARIDVDSGPDSGPLRDSGPRIDAGPITDCQYSSDCADGHFCARPRGQCLGRGVCTPLPLATGCPDIFMPVCGCDWVVYANACEASVAGVSVMQSDACPVESFEGEWCMLAPVAAPIEGCRRCFDDSDCSILFPFCVSSVCRPGGEGICMGDPGGGSCHDQRQCRADQRCEGAVIDECIGADGRCRP